MIRVVLDTNTVISGLLWSGSPRDVLHSAQTERVKAVTSEALVDELRDVIQREKFAKYLQRLKKEPRELVTQYLAYTVVIEPVAVPENAVRDIKDVKVLEAALGGQAVMIVSGDEDLLTLKMYQNITILNAHDFLIKIQNDNSL